MGEITLSLIQKYWEEYVITGFIGAIPTPIGTVLRNLIYPMVFKRFGKSAHIRVNARFVGVEVTEIGNNVRLLGQSNITSRGSQIFLKDRVSIDRGVEIRMGEDQQAHLEIGEDTYIGPYVVIIGPGTIKIGKDCLIAAHASLNSNNHIFAEQATPIRLQGITCRGIEIEDDCWLGTGVRVVDGVTIGKGCVVGAGAVVTRSLPPYSIAVGVPARVIGQRGQRSEHSHPKTAESDSFAEVWMEPVVESTPESVTESVMESMSDSKTQTAVQN
ncbi:MAG: acyltransferase [Oculatellaceae cyanobacterium Prado106]|jgi:acetyltransferase-like isoleucine patch superfamily enzyme|nr:acyltransferase [Oculatellaceae cyanobacterium Prado106]